VSPADVVAINYGQDFGWSGSLLAEFCAPPERSTVIVSHNFDRGPEIGRYEAVLTEEEFRRALASLRRSRYDQLAESSEAVPPETCFLSAGERRHGERLPTTRIYPVDALPAELAELRADFETSVIPRVRSTPVRVLSATATWQKPVFDPREALAIDVSLLCQGPLPIVIDNPLAPERRSSGLSLAIRNAAGRQTSVSLSATHLRAPPGSPGGDAATLVASHSLAFSIRKAAYLIPGVYDGMLAYRSDANDSDPQAIQGELWLPLKLVTISSPRPP